VAFFGFRYGSESPNIGIYRAMIAPNAEVVAGERVITVAPHRRTAYTFQFETPETGSVSN